MGSSASFWKSVSLILVLNLALELLVARDPWEIDPEVADPHTEKQSSETSKEAFYQLLLNNADRKIAERQAWLNSRHSEGSFFKQQTGGNVWMMFQASLPCLWFFEKVPDATILHDGGKWLCGLQELHETRKNSKERVRYCQALRRYVHCVQYGFP